MFENLHLTVINSALIYILLIVGIRVLGKKELGQLSVSDLIFIMLISEAVGDVMRASNDTIMGGVVAAVTLILLNKFFKYGVYKSKRFSKFMEGLPSVLVREGKFNRREMKRNKINTGDIEQAAREQGKGELSKVKLAILEKDGKISILDDTKIESSEEIIE